MDIVISRDDSPILWSRYVENANVGVCMYYMSQHATSDGLRQYVEL